MAPSSLRRRPASRDPQRRFTIFCEGGKTEQVYFRALFDYVGDANLVLNYVSAVGVPMTIAERAANYVDEAARAFRRRGKGDSFEENDETWAVFDRDKHPHFDEAVGLCHAKHVKVGRSNPCFEVWLILHKIDFHRPDDSAAVQEELREHCPEYNHSRGKQPDCAALIPLIEAAELRAERQLEAREGEGAAYGPPSTTVFQLTRSIRKAATFKQSDGTS